MSRRDGAWRLGSAGLPARMTSGNPSRDKPVVVIIGIQERNL